MFFALLLRSFLVSGNGDMCQKHCYETLALPKHFLGTALSTLRALQGFILRTLTGTPLFPAQFLPSNR